MDYTANYQLPQWVDSDRILRTDFNSAYQKLDAALDGIQAEVDANDAANTAAHAAFGNCQLYTATYVGTGSYGSSQKSSLTFPGEPLAVLIGECGGSGIFLVALQGMQQTFAQSSGSSVNSLTWGTNTLSWYNHQAASGQLNGSGVTYRVAALLAMDAE